MDKFLLHEALDRSYIIIENIGEHLLSLPAVKDDKDVCGLIHDARNKIYEAYCKLGAMQDFAEDKPKITTTVMYDYPIRNCDWNGNNL